MKHIYTALAGLLVLSQSAYSQTREDFTLGGLSAFVITPDSPAPGNPWIAYAPSVGANHELPSWTAGGTEEWMFDQYFAAGIAVAGIYSGDLAGNTVQRAGYTDLYNELVGNRGYAARFSFHTRSRGGLLGYNWAADHPGKVAAIGGIYPVTNLLSHPGYSQETINAQGLDNPIERHAPLADSGVRMFHIHGDDDGAVPLEENSQITKDRYDLLGGTMTLKVIVGGRHDGAIHWWTDQDLTDFMIAESLAAANPVGPPTLTILSSVFPGDDATNVTTFGDLRAVFSEPIALTGVGTITLKNLSGGVDIPVALPGDVTILGPGLIINPASNLARGEEYAVEISSDAIEDLDATPNPYTGLLSTDTPNWSFTTDGTAPALVSTVPVAGASNIPPWSDLTLTFSEDVQAASGNITIHRASDDSVVGTISMSSGAVTISGPDVAIDIPALPIHTSYYVNIAAGAIEDLSGNPFAGILDDTTWSFATGDNVGPITHFNGSFEDVEGVPLVPTGWTATASRGIYTDTVLGLTPTDGSRMCWVITDPGTIYQNTDVAIELGKTYTLTVDVGNISPFDSVPVKFRLYGNTLGFGTALGGAEGTAVANSATWSLNQTTSFTATAAEAGQTLGIALEVNGAQATWDNVRLEASSSVDTTPPSLTSKVPGDNATGVAANTNIAATFNEAIQLGVSGNITLDHLSGGTDVVIDVAAHGGQLSVAGNVLTIDPTSDLAAGVGYAVLFDAGAVTDTAGTPNAFAGISDPTAWNFVTAAPDTTDPDVSSLSPADNATGVAVGDDLVITFDEDVQKGTGDLVITETGGSTFETIPVGDARVSVSGAAVTINPTGTFSFSTPYHVEVASGAIEDLANNDFGGIAGSTAWNFTTAAVPIGGPITVANHSFEADGSLPTGWMADGAAGIYEGTTGARIPTDGTRMSWKNDGTLYQDTGEVIVEGATYTVTVDISKISNFDHVAITANFRLYGSAAGFGTALGGAEGTVDFLASPAGNGDWKLNQTTSFTATAAEAGQTLGVALEVDGVQANWDNIRLETTIGGGDTTPPSLTSKVPGDNATGVAANANIEAIFNDPIQLGVSGNITLDHLSGGTDVVIDVAGHGGQLSVAGNVLTIDPSSDLKAGVGYAVLFDAGSVTDTATTANAFAGISDPTEWNFATAAAPPGGSITLVNHSFETGAPPAGWGPDGWTRDGGTAAGRYDAATSGQSGTDGTHWLWINPGVTVYQDTSEVIVEGTTYTLTVDVGGAFWSGQSAIFRLYGSTAGLGTAVGGAEDSVVVASATWEQDQTVSFTATAAEAGQTLGIALAGTSPQVVFDNVRLTATAPPPTNTFVNWIDGFGLDPSDKDFGDDPDGDRIPNGLEAWFGTHPGEFNVGVNKLSTDGTTTTFEHPQNDDPPSDLTGFYEWSPNLDDWYGSGGGPGGGPTVSFVPNTVGTTTTVTATASEALQQLFLRVGVMQN